MNNKSYLNGYPWSAINRLDKYDMGVLSSLYIVFQIKYIDQHVLRTPMTPDEMVAIYDSYIPGLQEVDNLEMKQILRDIKQKHNWKMGDSRHFKESLMPFLDKL